MRSATYTGKEEFPAIKSCNEIPNRIIPFSVAMQSKYKNFDCWVCFYEHDYLFTRFWNNPRKYLKKLKKFSGVISPDFSVYANMPLVMQKYNIYKGRALANWLIENDVKVIPNVRLGDQRTYEFGFDGLYKHDIIAIGTVGTYKKLIEREMVIKAIIKTIDILEPKDIIIYGVLPKEIKKLYPNVNFHVYENYNYSKVRMMNNG